MSVTTSQILSLQMSSMTIFDFWRRAEEAAPVSATRSREVTPGWKLPELKYRLMVNGWPLRTIRRSTPFRSVRWSVLLNKYSRSQRSMSRALERKRETKNESWSLVYLKWLTYYLEINAPGTIVLFTLNSWIICCICLQSGKLLCNYCIMCLLNKTSFWKKGLLKAQLGRFSTI